MRPFTYHRPPDLRTAVAAVSQDPDAAYLAGGTNLVDLMKRGVLAPSVVVDLSGIGDESVDRCGDGGLRVGAGMRNSDLAAHPDVRRDYPVLARALLAGASEQLRNVATVGGNLVQRTRCVYFQDTAMPCNKRRPGSGCAALGGHHRDLAILGGSAACVATHPSDMAVALVMLDARVRLQGAARARVLPVAELHRLPGVSPQHETVLEHGELITSVELPPPSGLPSLYRKVRDRASFAFALVSVAAEMQVVDGHVRRVRLAFGGVAPKPWRARTAEALLVGVRADEGSFGRAVDAELAVASPLPGNEHKITLLRNVTLRSLLELAARS
ncbi:FAD binding domain-containing protein [Nonomuraea diastatica]|uniref:Xanthine dehydrogenase family protein subunit M n=1 Tax=Nonomuraea diastatica TaxID=1848329 RepID=A0A4R4X5R0_9ACTN|nr:xanthine dehydrogenase family protein subunit M [Nonomuraea diastatica]TDD25698.1 xanthine dehydrogenase family protein subunit M [Nonomuraea diastatica]